ncbi:type III-A CRISPR-associated protein Csm2 [Peptacetobacter hiranonis]|uniref:type III-A CRISPR-associated protein Csm2 n=1 Tax=Peptacetobacter hiranonis TaxID=89152 RepID=UPI0022E5F8AB|nr:type III-A CRISPR-associated protein Csm2 [Peptacetobacter hiranonis]
MKHINKVNYVDNAEEAIKSLIETDRNGNKVIKLTTSKIRNILMMVTDLYNEAIRCKEEQLSSDIVSRVKYMKMRLVYEIGRDIADRGKAGVEDFAKKAKLLEIIDSIGYSREDLILFCKYMEALVAYHKYYGGKDK